MKRISAIIFAILLVASCNDDKAPTMRDNSIGLNADIIAQQETRSGSLDIHKGTSTEGMTAGVWFSTTNGKYDTTDPLLISLPFHSTIEYNGGETPTTPYYDPDSKKNPLCYPTDNTSVYCVGLYPTSGWEWTTTADYTVARHTVNGKQDIMFAKQISGTWNNPFPRQQYKHLLMWIDVEMRATDHDAIRNWGKINTITIKSPSNKVAINLKSGEVDYNAGNAENIVISDTPTELETTIKSIGTSTLCIPQKEITLIIESDNFSKEVNVNLVDAGGNLLDNDAAAAGKLFIINLYFNTFNEIYANCSLIPWNEQEIEL